MRFWPFSRRVEKRSTSGFTALSIAARAETIMGRRGQAELTATVQAAVALWESALSLADVEGDGGLLTPSLLALVGRALALKGEAVFLIEDDRLVPVGDFDVNTTLGRPRAYRCSVYDAGTATTRTALAAEVLHFRHGCDMREPWRGVPPLARASLTGELLATVEAALAEVFADAPLGSTVAPMPEMTDDDRTRLAGSFRGQRGRVLIRESVTTTAAGGPAPLTDWKPQGLSPDLERSEVVATYDRARDAVCQAFGVDPSLLSSQANGPGLREAQRHLAQWRLQPLAALMAQEAGEKLGEAVTIDVMTPLAAYDQGGRARAFKGYVDAIAAAKEAGLSGEEVAAALAAAGYGDRG